MQEKIVMPYAPILVESTRSIGYSFEAAVADIIDNSISASATALVLLQQKFGYAFLPGILSGCVLKITAGG